MTHENSDYVEILRKKGYRVTPQRLTVLDAVCDVGGHATIGQIYQRARELDPAIDHSTIYRALEVLCDVGLVTATDMGEKVYEIAGATPHHHLTCRRCGTVFQMDHALVKPFFTLIQQQLGFTLTEEHLCLHGLCAACQAINATKRDSSQP